MALINLMLIIILANYTGENNTDKLDKQDLDLSGYDFRLLNETHLRKSNKERQNETIQGLDRYFLNNSIFADGITHLEIEKHSSDKKINVIENEFRQLLAMKGITYVYKRDTYWRTWREVQYPNGNKIVFYKCENSVRLNYTRCRNGGIWVMESELPPCPFELLSVINKGQLCAVTYTHFGDVMNSCPIVIKFEDLTGTCDNPIETKWRIKRAYNALDSERFPTVICGGREFCEISTSYTISPDFVAFRIINSTNDIIFSRIMKDGRKNYVCYEDCGYRDPKTLMIKKIHGP